MASSTSPVTVAGTTVRQLPPDEWHRLRDLPFARGGLPDPDLAAILVAESPDGEIVGIWAAFTAVHLDGLWVSPTYRRHSLVAARLLRGMKALLVSLGILRSFTFVDDAEVLTLALKAGFRRLPHDLLVLDLVDPAADQPGDQPAPSGETPCP